MVLDRILGSIQRDSSSKIISAKAVTSTYFIKNQAKYDKSTGQNVREVQFCFTFGFVIVSCVYIVFHSYLDCDVLSVVCLYLADLILFQYLSVIC